MTRLTAHEANIRISSVSQGRYTHTPIVNYIGYKNTRIKCTCALCSHTWESTYHSLIQGAGCPECAGNTKYTISKANKTLKRTLDPKGISFELLTEFHGIHKTQVKCTCKCSYTWESSFCNLVNMGAGCHRCGGVTRYTLDEIHQKLDAVSEGRYSYKKLKSYKNMRQRVECKCDFCGSIWNNTIDKLVNGGYACAVCGHKRGGDKQRMTVSEANERLQAQAKLGGYTTPTLTSYTGVHQRVSVTCNACGLTRDAFYGNLVHSKQGCPNLCFIEKRYTSQPENEIIDYIKQHYPHLEIQQSVRSLIKNPYGRPLEIDIYIPDLRLAFEFNGTYYHSDKLIIKNKKGFASAKQYHDYKTDECAKLGIKLIHIDEADWKQDKESTLNLIKTEIDNAIQNSQRA